MVIVGCDIVCTSRIGIPHCDTVTSCEICRWSCSRTGRRSATAVMRWKFRDIDAEHLSNSVLRRQNEKQIGINKPKRQVVEQSPEQAQAWLESLCSTSELIRLTMWKYPLYTVSINT